MTVYISTREAGRRLGGLDRETVVALIHAGELKGFAHTTARSGRVHAWKVDESSIDGYISRHRKPAPPRRLSA